MLLCGATGRKYEVDVVVHVTWRSSLARTANDVDWWNVLPLEWNVNSF